MYDQGDHTWLFRRYYLITWEKLIKGLFLSKHNILSHSISYMKINLVLSELNLLSRKLLNYIIVTLEKSEIGFFCFVFCKSLWYSYCNHETLIQKLEYYGIRGVTSTVCSTVKMVKSSIWIGDKCGVPQDCVLGTLLFLLYINDIVKSSLYLWTTLVSTNFYCI